MRFLNNQKIQTRILLVSAFPLLGLLILTGMLVSAAFYHMKDAQKLMELAEVAPALTEVVHDLQKERGKSAAYLAARTESSKYAAGATLKKMHKTSELHREELVKIYDKIHFGYFSGEFERLSKDVLTNLDDVAEKRKKILNGQMSVNDAKKSYTEHIRAMMDVIEYIASHSDDAQLTDQFAAYSSLIEAQEAMGKERALGLKVIQQAKVSIREREYLSELIGMQKAHIHTFEVYATKREKELYKDKVTGSKTWKHLVELREQFLDPAMEFQFFSTATVDDWFDTYTKEIDAITLVEEVIRDDIQKHVEDLRDKAKNEMLINVGTSLIQIGLAVLLVIFISRSITRPLFALTERMQKLANDDLDFEIPDVGKNNELADMAETLGVFRENAEQMKAMEAEQERLKAQAEVEKKEAMSKLADSFYDRTADLISSLTMSSDAMQQTAQTMSAASEETNASSGAVASAAQEADANVQTVAAASEQLAASSQEIAKQIADVATRASTAATEASQTSEAVNELEELAESIGDVVGAIKDIAEQTNLLALNATIEAARAGSAGKGFAVVADEVKKLANETGQKTEEIDQRVNRIQEAISNAVNAMGRIIENVQQIDHATSSVAGAVEEQNAATSEIGRNVAQASSGTQQVSQNIADVQGAASETGQASVDVLNSANELAEVSKGLQTEITNFLEEIRGDGNTDEAAPSDEPQAEDQIAAE